jgi:hypothetical protein
MLTFKHGLIMSVSSSFMLRVGIANLRHELTLSALQLLELFRSLASGQHPTPLHLLRSGARLSQVLSAAHDPTG